MNRLKIVFILIFIFSVHTVFSQKVTLSGVVKDAANGETIMGAYIIMGDSSGQVQNYGAVSNKAGFYSVSLPAGNYQVKVSFMGYKTVSFSVRLYQNITRNFSLEPDAILTDEVVVTGQRADKNISSVDVGKMGMKINTIKALPALFGEADVIKAIQLLPGVQSGGEGNSGFYVRGGGSDQNLVLLDEAVIYNASHLFGFFSVFNAEAVKNIDVIKSGMPAYYGGRLSSVLDVSQNEGNMKKFQVDGGIGLIFARLTVQGPIKKDKCSFIVSARRTYIDWLIQPFLKKSSPLKGVKFYFYDLNAKFNVVINDKHRLFFGCYYGNDIYGFKSTSGSTNATFRWANAAAMARWNYIITPKLFLNTSFTFSNYDFLTGMGMDVYNFNMQSGIRDYSLKTELTFLPNPKHDLRFGIHYIFHVSRPNEYNVQAGEGAGASLTLPASKPYYAHELNIYVNDEYEVCRWLKFNLGLRYSHFEHIGAFTRYVLNDMGYVVDSVVYKRGECVKQYNGLEPRFSARFLLDSNTSIKASVTLNYQYLHQIAMATISLPTDVWMPSTDIMKPQTGLQFSLGLFRNFHHNMFEAYIDGYYKLMYHLAEYKDGLDFSSLSINPDQMYTFGKGYSWGIEFFFKKSLGKFTGFVGYTLSYTVRQFDELNNGKPFYAKYDRRHDISINLSYNVLPNKLLLSAVWVFSSGNTMTIPVGFYFFGGDIITEYSARNEYRMPPYHRLDISVNWTIKKTSKFETGLNFSVYNVYNRKNPFFIFYETTTDADIAQQHFEMTTKAYQMSLFPIIPSITWNFKF